MGSKSMSSYNYSNTEIYTQEDMDKKVCELVGVIEAFERAVDIWLPKECLPCNVSEVEALHKLRSRYLHLIGKAT